MRKKILIIIIVFAGFYGKSYSQSIDSIACKKVEDTLAIIKAFCEDINSDKQLRRINTVLFLQRLTKIKSKSDISFAGPEFPKKDDYDKWNSWYIKNRTRLRWDNEEKIIYLVEQELITIINRR